MRQSTIVVTSEKATELLSLNRNNRPIRKSWVKQLSDAIKRGEWKTSHQGIAISKSGVLIDGQHRLMAIEHCGIPCTMAIAYDVDDDSSVCMDIGAKRSTNDMFNIGSPQAEVIRFAAKLIFTGAPTPQQVSTFIGTELHKSVDALHDHCSIGVKVYSSAPLRLAAALTHSVFHMNTKYQGLIFNQYRALCYHDFDSMDSTSKAYMKSIMASGKGSVIDQTIRFGHGVKLFNPRYRDLAKFKMLDSELSKILADARSKLRLISLVDSDI